jgi:hypothetical protein
MRFPAAGCPLPEALSQLVRGRHSTWSAASSAQSGLAGSCTSEQAKSWLFHGDSESGHLVEHKEECLRDVLPGKHLTSQPGCQLV